METCPCRLSVLHCCPWLNSELLLWTKYEKLGWGEGILITLVDSLTLYVSHPPYSLNQLFCFVCLSLLFFPPCSMPHLLVKLLFNLDGAAEEKHCVFTPMAFIFFTFFVTVAQTNENSMPYKILLGFGMWVFILWCCKVYTHCNISILDMLILIL